MRLYLRLFLFVYCWYRRWNGPDSAPAAWAGAILLSLHSINLVAIGLIVAPQDIDLYRLFKQLLPVLGLAFFVFSWYLMRHAENIEPDCDETEPLSTARTRWIFVGYTITSVVVLVFAIVWRCR